MNTEPIDKEDDVSIIQNPLYSLIMNCELQPEASAPNVSVSTSLLATNGYCSLHNGHLTSPVYILAHPSEDTPQIAFTSVSHQSQPATTYAGSYKPNCLTELEHYSFS